VRWFRTSVLIWQSKHLTEPVRILLVVGSGPDKEKLQTMAKANIEFLGWQDDVPLAKLYAAMPGTHFSGRRRLWHCPIRSDGIG